MVRNQNVDLNITPNLLNYFKYTPITSVDFERNFLLYKHILSNRRYNFQEHNLDMYITINFNSDILTQLYLVFTYNH
jgi:hypothetical protein